MGPTNPTWHLEMHDFLSNPQYEYSAHGLTLHTVLCESDGRGDDESYYVPSSLAGDTASVTSSSSGSWDCKLPWPLILYGSKTGNAEVHMIFLQKW